MDGEELLAVAVVTQVVGADDVLDEHVDRIEAGSEGEQAGEPNAAQDEHARGQAERGDNDERDGIEADRLVHERRPEVVANALREQRAEDGVDGQPSAERDEHESQPAWRTHR